MSDIPVLVVDVGSASLKAGYAGDDSPVTVIPSTAQKCAKGMEVRVHSLCRYLFVLVLNDKLMNVGSGHGGSWIRQR